MLPGFTAAVSLAGTRPFLPAILPERGLALATKSSSRRRASDRQADYEACLLPCLVRACQYGCKMQEIRSLNSCQADYGCPSPDDCCGTTCCNTLAGEECCYSNSAPVACCNRLLGEDCCGGQCVICPPGQMTDRFTCTCKCAPSLCV